MPTTISLMRHGAVHNPENIYYGRLPNFGLSDAGRRQAADSAAYLAGQAVTALYCSPLQRARETAAIVGRHLALVPSAEPLLLEVHTPYDGMPRPAMAARNWDLYSGTEPPFEQPLDVVTRLTRFFNRCRRDHVNEHVVGVTHGDLLAWAVVWSAAMELSLTNKQRLEVAGLPVAYPSTASVVTLRFAADRERPERLDYFTP